MPRRSTKFLGLPHSTKVEVIAYKSGKKTIKREMTYGKALAIKKQPGWTYRIYQLGYSQFKIEDNENN